MKKSGVFFLTFVSICQVVFAQKSSNSTTVMVTDTLHYYINKYYFKSGNQNLSAFPYYKSPAATSTLISHVGSKFENSENLEILGLFGFVSKGNSGQTVMPVNLYLCNLNTSGMPVFPPIDSVSCLIGSATVATPSLVGGYFKTSTGSGTISVSHLITGNFAVLIRNMSTYSGDTVKILRTAAKTFTNNSAAAAEKYSDGYGFIRDKAVFYSATNYTNQAFGQGSDYEFCVTPTVRYSLVASEILPDVIANPLEVTSPGDTTCAGTPYTFTNTSSFHYTHRMYNLNAFHSKWNLYAPFPYPNAAAFATDSAITWYFEFMDIVSSSINPRVYLPYNSPNNAITSCACYGPTGVFTINEFRARLKPMGLFGRLPQLIANEQFSVCAKDCGTVGIDELKGNEKIIVFPNPLQDGKTTFRGIKGGDNILVYDLLGHLLISKRSEGNNSEIDLSNELKGMYFVRIICNNGQSRDFKIMKSQ